MPFNILVVDDDADLREELRDTLEGYRVVEASSGSEALEVMGKPNEIDLVILDVVMPGVRWSEVLRTMKRVRPDLAVVILTGYGTKSAAIEALKGRADDFVEKTADMGGKIKDLVAGLLRSKAPRHDTPASGVDAKVRRVMYFVERNYDKNVSLEDVAPVANLSPKYLSRLFRQSAGIGFNEYKAKVKAKKAAELLSGSDDNIDEIAAKLGYANPESFARAFKKLTGTAPSAYRVVGRAGGRVGRGAGPASPAIRPKKSRGGRGK